MAKMNRRDFLAATVVLGAAGYAKNAWAVDYTSINPPASTADTDPAPFVPGSWTLAILPDPSFIQRSFPASFIYRHSGLSRIRTNTTSPMYLLSAT